MGFSIITLIETQVLLKKNMEKQYPVSSQWLLEFLRISFHKAGFFKKSRNFTKIQFGQ